MTRLSSPVDKIVRSFATKIDPRILKIYNTGAIFQTVQEYIERKDFKLDLDSIIDEDRLYLPFNNLIFELRPEGKPGDYYTFATATSDPNTLRCYSLLLDKTLSVIITYNGTYRVVDNQLQLSTPGTPKIYDYYRKKWKLHDYEKSVSNKVFDSYFKMFQQLISINAEYLSIINSSTYFILEERITKKIKSGRKTKEIIDKRFKAYTPREIRERYVRKTESSDTGSGSPLDIKLERRGHWRYFKNARFVNMKGKRKWIEPVWVGPSTFQDDVDPNKQYVVRLDL